MQWWQWLVDIAGILLLLIVDLRRGARRTPPAAGPQRRVRAQPPGRPESWVLGFGRYSGETLEWFRIFSLSARPKGLVAA